MNVRTMHLFAGHGGGLLADLILGHTPVVAVEWDGYACQVLRERAADGWFPGLRVHEGDVSLFDPSEYAGSVDCIHAGFPCQDISVAGKQSGVGEGTRSGLYREVLRIAGVVRPKQLFLENVSAILSNGLGTVLGDLAALGYDCRWLCIRASDVGAPHHRDRWFLLANASGGRLGGQSQGEVQQPRGAKIVGTGVLSDAGFDRFWDGEVQHISWQLEPEANACNDGKKEYLADSDSDSVQGLESGAQPGSDGRQAGLLSGAGGIHYWSEDPADAPQSLLGRVANGVPNRVHRLKGLGNAQCPLQAATAYRLLGGH